MTFSIIWEGSILNNEQRLVILCVMYLLCLLLIDCTVTCGLEGGKKKGAWPDICNVCSLHVTSIRWEKNSGSLLVVTSRVQVAANIKVSSV